jgi:hypothetical protein
MQFKQKILLNYYQLFLPLGTIKIHLDKVLLLPMLYLAYQGFSVGYFHSWLFLWQRRCKEISRTNFEYDGLRASVQISQILLNLLNLTIWGSIIGVVILLVGTTGVFVELQKSLNFIWHVEVIPKKGIFTVLKEIFIWINISHRFCF